MARKRVFESLVITVSHGSKRPDSPIYESFKKRDASAFTRDEVCRLLVESGEWTAIRQRPFEKVAPIGGEVESVFVTAIDTNPLGLDPALAIEKWKDEFETGLEILSKLPKKQLFLCTDGDINVKAPGICKTVAFNGPHPAGNVGTHIHFLQPINLERNCWHVGYQDVIAIGHLFKTGTPMREKLVCMAGPLVKKPKVVEVLRGAQISELTAHELVEGEEPRVISGSVFSGRVAVGSFDYIGQFHNQITVIKEDTKRELLGWKYPGFNKFSTKQIFISKLIPGKRFDFGSSTNGSLRAMVPIGMFENIMPLDILPTQLLRAIASGDVETAQDLGCLELAEEDLALCTYVAPGKVDFGPLLRKTLDAIEREG